VYESEYTRTDAAIYGVTVLAAALVVAAAWAVEPASQGFGTHERLGLPPCLFLRFTGLPCPSCGLTTCFAYAAKLQFRPAATAHPFGLVQFGVTVAAIPGGAYLLARRIPFDRVAGGRGLTRVLWIWLALYAAGWVYKAAAMW
jgi:hypothetical protein